MAIVGESQNVTPETLPSVSTMVAPNGLLVMIGDQRQRTARAMQDVPIEKEKALAEHFQGGVLHEKLLPGVPATLSALLAAAQAQVPEPPPEVEYERTLAEGLLVEC